mgnify:CR=1 FL=1
MTDDVGQLKAFYDSPAGHKQCRIIREKIRLFWPFVEKEKIIGYGFTLPYLPVFGADNNMLALTPASIGALDMHQGILSVMADETQLPVRNEVIDKILAAHALENAADVHNLIFEFWRILKPYGRALFIFEKQKFELDEITGVLLANKFSIIRKDRAVAKLDILESFIGKIYIIEAQKLVFAPRGRTQKIVRSLWDKLARPKPAVEAT